MVTVWEYSPGDVFFSMIWFCLVLVWLWLVVAVLSDLFRSEDLSGWSKALWTVFVIVLPYLGVLVYLVSRGGAMSRRESARARRRVARHTARSDPPTSEPSTEPSTEPPATDPARAETAGTEKEDTDTAPPALDPGTAAELERLEELRRTGQIDDAEFQRAKSELLA